MESAGGGEANRRDLLYGAAAWAIFCVVAVALRGVRWDEDYEFAQAIARVVPYPEGHPLFRYVRGLYSIQSYGAAALLLVTKSPGVVCGVRNVVFLAATVLPAFFIVASLTRRVAWGHVGAAIILLGTHLSFYSTYPQFVWPHMYSNGHIGTGYALLSACALWAGCTSLGFFLVGLMPCVHLGQWPPVLAFTLLYTLWRVHREGRQWPWRAALIWGAAGLGISACVWFAILPFAVPDPAGGPYYSAASADAVWRGYMERFAPHRAIPWDTGHIPLVALPLLAVAAWWQRRKDVAAACYWGVLVYGICIAAIVWAIMAVQMAMGPRVPYVLITWMPYRLMNHVPPLLLFLSVAVLAENLSGKSSGAFLPIAALCYGIAAPWFEALTGHAFYARYLADGAGVFFGLCGGAWGTLARGLRGDKRFFVPWLAASFAAWAALSYTHQFGAACAAAGAGACASWAPGRRFAPAALAVAIAMLTTCTLTYRQWHAREHLAVTPFEQRVAAYLDAQGQPDALLVASYEQETLQARTGHPIMADMATITWIAYKPSLGPAMDKMYGDIWGIHFAAAPDAEAGKKWFERWATRPNAEWQRLHDIYAFAYVVAPNFIALDLPRVVEGADRSLYHIPARTPRP